MSDDDVLRDGDTDVERTRLAKYQPLEGVCKVM